jgi:phosphoribosylamine--glycine ligase
VIKADGLAAGKGVTVATQREDAVAAIETCLIEGAFGAAGSTIVVEELLEGPEVSVFAVTDGTGACVLLDVAADHKRIGDGDLGPNTGGMGAYSPVPAVEEALGTQILDTCIAPVVDELRPYQGVLFAGVMLTDDGPHVLEFNCRFGDPETQSLLPRLETDLLELLAAAAGGDLAGENVSVEDNAAVTVVVAAGDYPEAGDVGTPIEGIADAEASGALVFHAGTALKGDQIVTNGGLRADLIPAYALPPRHRRARPCLSPSSASWWGRSPTASACRTHSTSSMRGESRTSSRCGRRTASRTPLPSTGAPPGTAACAC